MSSMLAKEFRPLILPACIAAGGSIIPPVDDLTATLGSLATFGGFAVLAAMTFGLEFQQHTLTLLLSQPVERKRLWQNKTLIVLLAGMAVSLVNWQFQQFLSDMTLPLLFAWMFLLASVCSSGFWIQSTGSILGGLACAVLIQLFVFGGLAFVIKHYCELSVGLFNADIFIAVFVPSILYCTVFLWFGRRFWRRNFLKIGPSVLLFLLLCGLSQWLATHMPVRQTNPAETFMQAMFLLALICSSGFWAILARTTIGGATLGVAFQFLVGVVLILGLSQIYGVDADIEQTGFVVPVAVIFVLYCAGFLWLGWRKFERLELKSAPAGLEQTSGWFYRSRWSPNWLRCQANQHLLNLVRKELRLQKPLLLLAAIFLVCWLAAFALQWLVPQRNYANLKDILSCLYTPLMLLLAGCVSLGDEKVLGVTGWQLALPICARTQWLVKLLVAALSGVALGLVIPWFLCLVSALATGTEFLGSSSSDPLLSIAAISGGLFILGFWAATLFSNAVRAALSAVAALIAFSLCMVLGNACAERVELLRDIFAPVIRGLIVPFSQRVSGLDPGAATLVLGLVVAIVTVLAQSLRQFRRVQLPTAVLIKRPLTVAAVFLLLGLLLRAAA
jgi:hypothetical protein